MKNIKRILLLLVVVLVLSGCGLNLNSKTVKCKLKNDQSKIGYNINSEYVIYSSDGLVNKVESIEEITSKNNTFLAYFENQYKGQYKDYNQKYGGYKYNISLKGQKVTAKVTIDYNKYNMQQFIKDNAAMKEYTKNNKFTLDGIKRMYKSMGATCEK